MQLALSTESLKGYGIQRIFRFAKEAGFDGIGLAMINGEYDTLDTDYIKEVADKEGVPVLSIQTPAKTSKAKITEAVKMAKVLGTRIIVIQPPKIFDQKMAKWLKTEIPKIRQKENISIALENAATKTMLGFIPEHAMSSTSDLKKFKHVSLDTSRAAEKKTDLLKLYETLKPYMVHVHLSNTDKGKGYAAPEVGSLPLEGFLTKLKSEDFKGVISVKVKPKNYHAGDEKKMLQDLKNSVEFCKKFTK
jgi:sugar phosphate isomerase/epimerase